MTKDAGYYRAYRQRFANLRIKNRPDLRLTDEERRERRNAQSKPHPYDSSLFTRGEFIAWDGEGYTDASGVHRYFLLGYYCASGESGFLENPNGIDTETGFNYLLSVAERHPKGIHVCYGASYDVNMLLKDLDWSTLERLWKNDGGKRVNWNAYELVYQQRKCLHLRERKQKGRSITLWDVIGFFQTTFVRTIREHLGDDYSGLQVIERGKSRRSQFDINERDDIRRYTLEELKALVLIMEKLRGYIAECGIKLSRWDGAGAIAAALLKKHNVKQHMAETPKAVQEAAQYAYFGGRAELMQYGQHDGPVYHYDINSAYPTAVQHLPGLHGAWCRETGNSPKREQFSVSKVRWNFSDNGSATPFYPLPYRTDDGSIYFPSKGEGWYWEPEVSAALETVERYITHPSDYLEILETWSFYPETAEKPFAFVPELFQLRKQWKEAGIQAQYALKLGLNSIYGKLAQQVGGWVKHGTPRKPAYHQLEWAGWVTAFARANLLTVMAQRSKSIIMVATDGIYATEPLTVTDGSDLGEWESNTHDGMVAVQSGVYWLKDGDTWKAFRRGFDAESLGRERVLEAWQQSLTTYRASSTRFITLGSGIYNKTLRSLWRTWRTAPRELSLYPEGKRTIRATKQLPAKRLEATEPTMLPEHETFSHPFPLRWGVSLDVADSYALIDGVPQRVYDEELDE